MSCSKTQDPQLGDQSIKPLPKDKELIDSFIIGEVDWFSTADLSPRDSRFELGKSVGTVMIPNQQSRCTGFLVSPDILMTNHHCVPTASDVRGLKVYFDHVDGKIPQSYSCETLITNNEELDFAFLRCSGQPGENYGHLVLSNETLTEGEEMFIIQQNCDYYTNPSCDYSQKIAGGEVKRVGVNDYTHNIDVLGGSSGSPTFHGETNKVIAILNAGYGNNITGRGIENYSVRMDKILAYLNQNHDSLYREILSLESPEVDPPLEEDSIQYFELNKEYKSEITQNLPKQELSFELTQTSRVHFSLEFDHARGDLDFFVKDSQGVEILRSNGTTNKEEASSVLSSGNYTLVIYGYNGDTGSFRLFVQTSVENDSPSLSQGQTKRDFVTKDEDKAYLLQVVESSTFVELTLEHSYSQGDLDLYLYDENQRLISYSNGLSDKEVIQTELTAGRYYVIVRGYNSASGNFVLTYD